MPQDLARLWVEVKQHLTADEAIALATLWIINGNTLAHVHALRKEQQPVRLAFDPRIDFAGKVIDSLLAVRFAALGAFGNFERVGGHFGIEHP